MADQVEGKGDARPPILRPFSGGGARPRLTARPFVSGSANAPAIPFATTRSLASAAAQANVAVVPPSVSSVPVVDAISSSGGATGQSLLSPEQAAFDSAETSTEELGGARHEQPALDERPSPSVNELSTPESALRTAELLMSPSGISITADEPSWEQVAEQGVPEPEQSVELMVADPRYDIDRDASSQEVQFDVASAPTVEDVESIDAVEARHDIQTLDDVQALEEVQTLGEVRAPEEVPVVDEIEDADRVAASEQIGSAFDGPTLTDDEPEARAPVDERHITSSATPAWLVATSIEESDEEPIADMEQGVSADAVGGACDATPMVDAAPSDVAVAHAVSEPVETLDDESYTRAEWPVNRVADTLEAMAQRVRRGEIVVSATAGDPPEAILAKVLAQLLTPGS